MKPRETDLVKSTLTYLKLNYPKGVFWRSNTGAFAGEYKGRKRFVRFGVPGMSDIQGVMRNGLGIGVPIFIECKIGKAKLSEAQEAFRDTVTAAGAQYHVTREVGDFVL
jgi:hypothetical protein